MPKEEPRFVPKPTGFSSVSHRFWLIITLPFRRRIPGLVFATTAWIITYNVCVRMWKGPDHPVNRFQWRKMEKAGKLPEEMIQKKKTFLDYHKSRFFGLEGTPVSLDKSTHM